MNPREEELRIAIVKKMYDVAESDVPVEHLNYLSSYAYSHGGPFSLEGQKTMITGLNVLIHVFATKEHKDELDMMALEVKKLQGEEEDCESCEEKDTCTTRKLKEKIQKAEKALSSTDEDTEEEVTPIPDYILRAFDGPIN